jgi:hypothetical protein
MRDARTPMPRGPSWVARAWEVARAHLCLGEMPIERLDIADLPSASSDPAGESARASREPLGAPERAPDPAERRLPDPVDESVDESFPASDPPSWTSSHA